MKTLFDLDPQTRDHLNRMNTIENLIWEVAKTIYLNPAPFIPPDEVNKIKDQVLEGFKRLSKSGKVKRFSPRPQLNPDPFKLKIIDPHIHMYSRVTDDYEKMALCGVRVVVEPSFWLGEARTTAGTLKDYWEYLIGYERTRAKQFGIEHYCTISLNPKEANNASLAKESMDLMERYLDRDGVVGVGEIGFDAITKAEEEAFRRQLLMADSKRMPVIIHTPHLNKLEGVKKILKIIKEEKVDQQRIIVDHNTEETLGLCLKLDVWAAITIYPLTKMSPFRAVNLMKGYGTDRILLNSSADWGVSDPLSVPKTAYEMRQAGFSWDQIEKVVFRNPLQFFKQSPRFAYNGS